MSKKFLGKKMVNKCFWARIRFWSKEMLGQKLFWVHKMFMVDNKIWIKRNLKSEKKIWSKISLSPKNLLSPNSFGSKKFKSKKCWVLKKIVGPKKCCVQKDFGFKINFGSEKIYLLKKNRYNNFGLEIFLRP